MIINKKSKSLFLCQLLNIPRPTTVNTFFWLIIFHYTIIFPLLCIIDISNFVVSKKYKLDILQINKNTRVSLINIKKL